MSAKYKSPSFLLPNELNTSTNPSLSEDRASMYSMDFNSSDTTMIGFNPTINLSDTCSISFWINLTATSGTNYANNAPIGSATSYIVFLNNASGVMWFRVGGNYLILFNGNGDQSQSLNNFLTAGSWNHIVITRNQDDISVYINGYKRATNTQSSFSGDTVVSSIGAQGNNVNNTTGKIDEVTFYKRVLTDGGVATDSLATGDIAALYNSGSPASSATVLNLSPFTYYPLGEQAQNTGKLPEATANVWQFPNGVLQDYVMDFDGNSKINCGPAKAYNIVTLSAWVKPDSPATYDGIFGTRNGSSVDFPYQLTNFGGKFRFIADGNTSILSNNNFNNGVWYHVMGIADGTNLKMYVDGQLQSATASYSTPLPTPNNDLMIGAQWNTDTQYEWSGEISNVAIWNTDQSANVANIYNNGSPQTSYTVTPQNWWKLNADSVYTPSAPNYTTALDFNGTSDFIDITQSGTLPPNSGDFTYSSWVNIDPSTSINIIVLLNKGDAWPGNGILIRYRSYFEVLMNGVVYGFTGLSAVDGPGVWRHFALVFDETANTLTAYVDTNKQVLSATTTLNVSDANFIIGKRQNNIQYFKGKMSNLAVYSSALSDSQISTLFNFGTPEITPSFSPAAWWKLDNTTTGIQDSSGNGNNGTNNGTTQLSTSVAFVPSWKIPSALTIPTVNYTSALEFNSTNTFVNVGALSNFITNNVTVSLWANFDTLPSGYDGNLLISAQGTSWDQGLGFVNTNSSGNIRFFIENWDNSPSGTGGFVDNTTTIITNQWYHFCGTWDGSTVKYYINGNLQGSASYTGSITTSHNLLIGTAYNPANGIDGKISNTAIYNSALSSSQVSTLYNSGQPESAISFSPVGWWKLDTGGSTITDYGSGGNNGANNGAAQVTSDVLTSELNIPVNGVSTTLPSTALQQSDLQFDSPYSNYSLSFDGTGDYIDFGNSLNFVTSNYSLSFWIKTTSTTNLVICEKGANDEIAIQTMPSGNIRWAGTNGSDTSGVNVSDNNWHHLVFVANGSSSFIYIDGSLNTTGGNKIQASSNTDNFYIGSRAGLYGFNGKLDETSLFNYALSSAQVLEIYNNGRPKDLTTFSGTAPISWWRLGENAYFDNNSFVVPNSITGAPNGTGSGSITSMLTADAPGTYANGIGTNLDIVDRVGDAPLSIANSQSYNIIPDDKIPYVPGYVGLQTTNAFEMAFDGINDYFNIGTNIDVTGNKTFSFWIKRDANAPANDGGILSIVPTGATSDFIDLAIFQDQIQGVAANGGAPTKELLLL